MRPVLSAAEMREADRRTIEEVGLPGAVLMENAGAAVARAVRERFPGVATVAVLCGKGSNGGDGLVCGRRLRADGLDVSVFLVGRTAELKGDAALHLRAYLGSGGRLAEVADEAAWEAARASAFAADLLVDALLGTGLRARPEGLIARVVAQLGALPPSRRIVAVDMPSGVPSDSGDVDWPTAWATVTVTFAAPKHGHVLPPACDAVGDLVVADIGIPAEVLLGGSPTVWLVERSDVEAAYGARPAAAHKGTFGHVLVVAGSVGKTGAAVLAGTGALRAGAGLVTVATPAPVSPLVAAARPELMTEPLAVRDGGLDRERDAVDRVLALARGCDAVVVGPGLGQAPGTQDFVRAFARQCPAPMVIDADGLNALASGSILRGGGFTATREAPTVLTPHPGEMARLLNTTAAAVQARRLPTARTLAVKARAVVVLKGQRTLVADPDARVAINPTGNPGMATAGTGDVLAGMIGALLARGRDPWTAAAAAVHLHGAAGDHAARRVGQDAMIASDLLDALPDALRGPRG